MNAYEQWKANNKIHRDRRLKEKAEALANHDPFAWEREEQEQRELEELSYLAQEY